MPVSFIFILVFIKSSAEELLCRCYLYQKLIQSYKNPLVAIIGNSMFFGLPNSGLVVPYSVFKLEAGSAANSFAYDVDFGVEGTLVACIMFLLVNVALYFWYSRHPQKSAE